MFVAILHEPRGTRAIGGKVTERVVEVPEVAVPAVWSLPMVKWKLGMGQTCGDRVAHILKTLQEWHMSVCSSSH